MAYFSQFLSLHPCTNKLNLTSLVRCTLFQTVRYVGLVTFLAITKLMIK
jgi:hypothetical protein